jgi:hypothetical protein
MGRLADHYDDIGGVSVELLRIRKDCHQLGNHGPVAAVEMPGVIFSREPRSQFLCEGLLTFVNARVIAAKASPESPAPAGDCET